MDLKSSGKVQLEVQKAIHVKTSLAGNVGSAGCFSSYLQLAYHLVSEFMIQRILFLALNVHLLVI